MRATFVSDIAAVFRIQAIRLAALAVVGLVTVALEAALARVFGLRRCLTHVFVEGI
jgi:hypothetical protein